MSFFLFVFCHFFSIRIHYNGSYSPNYRVIQIPGQLSYVITCDGTALLLISLSSLDMGAARAQRAPGRTMERRASHTFLKGCIEFNEGRLACFAL